MSKEQQQIAQHGQKNKQLVQNRTMSEMISDFLFRWRKWIFILFGSTVVLVIAWAIYASLLSQERQATAGLVYDLRRSFANWQEAHPADLLTASQSLKEQGEEELELDGASQKKAEETEQDLKQQIQESVSSTNKKLQAWGYWIEAQRAVHLKQTKKLQTALENLVALGDKTFDGLAKLHLAGLLYSEDKTEEAVALWQGLTDIVSPEPSQIVAGIYLANYFARKGQKEEAIQYWQLVQSLGEEMLQINGLSDETSFLGSENNIITGSFRNSLKQWKAMAENQLLFLQSKKIQVAADSYDETAAVPTEEAIPESSVNNISFDTNSNLPELNDLLDN